MGNLCQADAIPHLKKVLEEDDLIGANLTKTTNTENLIPGTPIVHEYSWPQAQYKLEIKILIALLKLGCVDYVKKNCSRFDEGTVWDSVRHWRKTQKKDVELPE